MVPSPQPASTAGAGIDSGPTAMDKDSTLRQRKVKASLPTAESISSNSVGDEKSSTDISDAIKEQEKEEINWGKTATGEIFKVPNTQSFLHTLLYTTHKSSLTRLTLFSLLAQPLLFWLLRNHGTIRSVFFLFYFAFWRGAYDFGFAWLLRKQSEKKYIQRWLKTRGWLDLTPENGNDSSCAGASEGLEWAKWWKRELTLKMDESYQWENVPQEFNAWLMFRQLVDIVLLNDFVSYTCFAWSNLHFPPNHSVPFHILRWVGGWSLILFNLWVKIDAHRVVKDYAWYWGDAFWMMVMQNDLVFDGVYEIAPHPMYSVGYAGYYGLSMVVGSYTVLFVSLAAHAAQFAFLLWFENPHIERTYGGGQKPLVSRAPLTWEGNSSESAFAPIAEEGENPTPSATEGETENEAELPELPPSNVEIHPVIRKPRSDSLMSSGSNTDSGYPKYPSSRKSTTSRKKETKKLSMHDLTHRFFRKPTIVLSQLDLFRANDFALVVLIAYAVSTLIPHLGSRLALTGHFVHALLWRLFHSYGLGLLLRAQSKSKWLVRHYLKHYHYPGDGTFDLEDEDEGEAKEDVVKRATEEAFGNWQVIYNISLVMTYVSFAGLAWKTYHLPSDWTVSGTILRHVLGLLLVALHVWSAVSSYEVLGDFGWLYSDFFLIEQIPSQLAYTGIYRFLNNPERSMGGAAFLGLWLISNSKLVLIVALASHLSHQWFLTFVEQPHMKKLYGDRLRKDGGLTKTLKNVADKTLSTKGGRRGSEIRRVVQEVKGSIEKVEEKVTEAVEEFLDHARPMFSDMVHDTKILLQHSRERMIITRIANDISAYDPSRYSLTLPTSSSSPAPRYHVGQPIRVSWTAPSNHSRKDWIGIYRLGSCKSTLVTRISSVGKWMPINEEEWDGDTYLNPLSPSKDSDAGEVLFKGEQLPWSPGQYEVRYHHDGKHNVMSRVVPIEIFVSKPTNPDSIRSIRSTLLDIVALSLDNDPKLVPRSAKIKTRKDRTSSSASISHTPSSTSISGSISLSSSIHHQRPSGNMNNRDVSQRSIGSALSSLANLEENAISHYIGPGVNGEDISDVSSNKAFAMGEEDESTTPSSKSIPIPILSNRAVDVGIDVGIDPEDDLLGASPSSIDLHSGPTAPFFARDDDGVGGDDQTNGEGKGLGGGDQDDFIIMTPVQAQRISDLCQLAFGVEVSKDVVVADANVGALARRVAGARGLTAGNASGANNVGSAGVGVGGGGGVGAAGLSDKEE